MALINSPGIITNGLIFYYDMINYHKSWKGQPTTNLVNSEMFIYNNVSGDVTASLTTTGDTYKGASIYRLTLTPTTASGVSYLTAGNNPGIGVISNGGGGTANRYTGHSIFYRSTVPMHTTPLYTNYSNIAGWGAGSLGSNRSVNMYDGWFRGEVLWYDTVTRSDGKYWAINPATATLNIPVIIYWAGPFKEDRNDSAFIAPYTPSSRSNTQTVIDLTGRRTITVSGSPTYGSDGTFTFNSSGSTTLNLGSGNNFLPMPSLTLESWIKTSGVGSGMTVNGIWGFTYGIRFNAYSNGSLGFIVGTNITTFVNIGTTGVNINDNNWHHVVAVKNEDSYCAIYVDGVVRASGIPVAGWDGTNIWSAMDVQVGRDQNDAPYYFNGRIDIGRVYNIGLSESQVRQNFNAQRGLYGL